MCTDFSIKAVNSNFQKSIPVIGRSMELGPDLKSELFFRPEKYIYKQIPLEAYQPDLQDDSAQFVLRDDIAVINERLLTWTGNYGFVAMNGFKLAIAETFGLEETLANIVTNGFNTEGLTTGAMVLAQSEYQYPISEACNKQNIIYYPSLTAWILSSCSTCQDVINGLDYDKLVLNNGGSGLKECNLDKKDKILVVSPFSKVPNAMKFHFPVHDAEGNSIVLEYTQGKLTITDLNPIGVLTNDPLIAWQQENVRYNYVNVVPFNFQNEKGEPSTPSVGAYESAASNFQCNSYAQGTGFSGVPGSSTPVDRFVRAAMMTNFSFPVTQFTSQSEIDEANDFKSNVAKDAELMKEMPSINNNIKVGKEDATTLAFHILNTVDIPLGTSRDSQGENVHDFTQWVTVSDLKNKRFSVRMYQSPQVFSINLMDLELGGLKDYTHQLDTNIKSMDITAQLNKNS